MQFHQKSIKRLNIKSSRKFSTPTISSLFFCLPHQFQVVAGISVFFICTSVISFCLKTLPGLRVEIPLTLNHTSSNLSDIYQASTLPPSTTEANFITIASTHRSPHGGSFNRYSVRMHCCRNLLMLLYAGESFFIWR